ncbi:hypothetical protein [Ideonella sp. BN130291]|uniref:hypothetical protein n=1 Tax=Ideonella sp. BN130291 TaxID=3112940 RepID=UPI002E26C47C|nr:hypothetical protein [Ideonella sp. BN130291]
MRDFEDSTLWRVSEFERVRERTGASGFARLAGPTLLPTTLLADLRRLHRDPQSDDALEVVAACVRHREAALLCLQVDQLVWPVTLFPQSMLYHSPRDLAEAGAAGFAALTVLSAEPPGVRPPGHWMHERVAHVQHYRPLPPLLWDLALRGPRRSVLTEIGGRAAYRLVPSRDGAGRLSASGALGPAMQRLQRESVSLREIASWPGLDVERASRLLNALYLTGSLLVSRSHPAAREQPGLLRSLFGAGKPRA